MAFKNFRAQIILRVLLLAAILTLLAWCLVNDHFLRAVYGGVAAIISVVEFIWYVDRFNRDISSYLISLMQNDFTTHFQSRGRSKSFNELYECLNRIAAIFRSISAEKEVQFRFLEMLVEHLRVGIISIDHTGKIVLANQAMKDLLQKDVLFSVKSIESYSLPLAHTVRTIRSGETQLVKLQVQDALLQLSVHASEFRLEGNDHKLISMQNISNELDNREMEAWQKLIRVLTHEIMNSVSPITSLSETLHKLVLQNERIMRQDDPDLYNTLDKGLEAIKVRSEGLFGFTQSYRKLTGIPKISLKQVSTKEIISRVAVLMENKMSERRIKFTISDADIPVTVDPDLMEHVLINLLLNATDAVAETEDPAIELSTKLNTRGEVSIHVCDNGEGIDEASAEKIFIPFFTTRRNGSGIGLALAKQILQLHHADITFQSQKGEGTEFIIRL
jgi:two-component system, NtrC family, nitrogen regulation sensor histidine kinase NtrY